MKNYRRLWALLLTGAMTFTSVPGVTVAAAAEMVEEEDAFAADEEEIIIQDEDSDEEEIVPEEEVTSEDTLEESAELEAEVLPDEDLELEDLIEEETEAQPEGVENVAPVTETMSLANTFLAAGQAEAYFGTQLTTGTSLNEEAKKLYDSRVQYYVTEGNTDSMVLNYDESNWQYSPVSFPCEVSQNSSGAYVVKRTGSDLYTAGNNKTAVAVQASYDAFLYDHPEVFWYKAKEVKYSFTPVYVEDGNGEGTWYAYLSWFKNDTYEAYAGARNDADAFENAVSSVVSELRQTADYNKDGTTTDVELLEAAHNYVCNTAYYDSASLSRYNSYQGVYDVEVSDWRIWSAAGAFLDSVGNGMVCEGYAKSLKILLDRLGVPCVLVGGSAIDSSTNTYVGHMWCDVQIAGSWYMVDPTYDDPAGEDAPNYNYYLTAKPADRFAVGNLHGSTLKGAVTFTFPTLASNADKAEKHAFSKEEITCADGTLVDQYTCGNSGCPATYWDDRHSWTSEVIPATCTKAGYTLYTCSEHAGETRKGNYVAATGHQYDENGICSVDGAYAPLSKFACDIPEQTYNGSEIMPENIDLYYGSTHLIQGVDYSVAFYDKDANHTSATASGKNVKLLLTGTGSYTGKKVVGFTIAPKELTKSMITVNQTEYTYTGSKIYPSVTIVDDTLANGQAVTLKEGVDYSKVGFTNPSTGESYNTNVGDAYFGIKGIGNYTTTKTIQLKFTIVAASTEDPTEPPTEPETEPSTPSTQPSTEPSSGSTTGTGTGAGTGSGQTTQQHTTHTYDIWEAASDATVFSAATEIGICSECGAATTRTVGSKLAATIRLNVSGTLPMKTKQKTTKVTVSGLAAGDAVESVTSSKTKFVTTSWNGSTLTLKATKKTGKSVITVKTKGGATASFTVKVQKKKVATKKVTVISKKVNLKVGESFDLAPVIQPITSADKLKCTTSKKGVAAVSKKGVVKAKKAGKAKITLKAGKKKVVVTVTVTK